MYVQMTASATDNASDYESGEGKSEYNWPGNRLFTPMFLVKQNTTTLSTDTRKTLLQPKEEVINQRGHSVYSGDES